MLISSLKNAVLLQQLHLVLSALWNVAGVWLINQGQAAPGPTASLTGALMMLLVCGLLNLSSQRWQLLYLATSVLLAVVCTLTIYSAFTKDPGLWPSEFWRLAGVVLNSLGLTGSIWGFLACAKSKTVPSSPLH